MPDYSKGLIYKITCLDSNIKQFYVGSTTNFKQRKNQHKSSTLNAENNKQKVYKFIRDNGGWNNWNMIWIKDFSCNKVEELKAEEDKIMRELGATLNSYPAVKEPNYYLKNKKKICDYQNKRRELIGKEEIAKIDKTYRDKNKDKLKTKNKEYYENNKLIINEKNMKKYNEQGKKKIVCECGKTHTLHSIKSHLKTKNHLAYEFLKLIENSNHSKEI